MLTRQDSINDCFKVMASYLEDAVMENSRKVRNVLSVDYLTRQVSYSRPLDVIDNIYIDFDPEKKSFFLSVNFSNPKHPDFLIPLGTPESIEQETICCKKVIELFKNIVDCSLVPFLSPYIKTK